jgi:hypothetical protein
MESLKPTVDVRSFLAFWGGPTALIQVWAEHGIVLTKGQVQKWQSRNSIPSKHLAQAAVIASKLRRPIDLDLFIRP